MHKINSKIYCLAYHHFRGDSVAPREYIVCGFVNGVRNGVDEATTQCAARAPIILLGRLSLYEAFERVGGSGVQKC